MANFQDLWLYRHLKAHMFYNKKGSMSNKVGDNLNQ